MGFREIVGDIKVGHVRIVEEISNDYIRVRGGTFPIIARYPYFAIEKVKDEYRPFKDAEEFKPYRDEWFIFKESGYKVKFGAYGKDGVYHSNGMTNDEETTYEQLFERFTFEWGKPAGIKL